MKFTDCGALVRTGRGLARTRLAWALALSALSPLPALAQDASAGAETQAAAASEQGDAEAGPRFDIMEFEVAGNSVLSAADIQRALTPFTGYDKGVSDVTDARDALERAYRERGFATVVVDVPAQDVREGVVKLQVVEGRVDQVRVLGARYVLPSEVRESLPGLQSGAVPNVPALQAELAEANSRPARQIAPEFRAGAAPGTVDVDLVVEDQRPWGASIEVNDQFNRSTERYRLNASAHYDNLWQRGHSANVAYQTAPEDPDQVQVISGSYFAPLGYGRTSVLGYVVQSNTDVATVGGLAVIGDGLTVGGRLMHTLEGAGGGSVQSLMFGFDYKDYQDEIGVVDPLTGDVLTFQTPITYLPFTLQYRYVGGNARSNSEFSVATTFAFDGLVGQQAEFGGVPDDPFTPGDQSRPGKRAFSEASFVYFAGSAIHNRRLPWGLQGRVAFDWQLAPAPLISNEQFVLGGVGSIRGYREAEVLGDNGARLSLQLDRPIPLAWAGSSVDEALDLTLGVFAEGGYAQNNDPLPEEVSEFSLGSAGVSLRASAFKLFFTQLDLAYQFADDPTESGAPVFDDAGDARLHVKFGLEY